MIFDASGNPYLTFSAMLYWLDGIKNKLIQGESFDKDLYSLSEDEIKNIQPSYGSLREAMESLDTDRDFLKTWYLLMINRCTYSFKI